MAAAARGRIEGDVVVVDDAAHAHRLHAKSGAGTLSGDTLRLTRVEAAWLASEGKLEVVGSTDPAAADAAPLRPVALLQPMPGRPADSTLGFEVLRTGHESDAARPGDAGSLRTEVGFLAYSDLRNRGLLVAPWQGSWAVWPRGGEPKDEPEYALWFQAERDPVTPASLLGWAQAGAVAAVVDEDGATTYYRAAVEEPSGECPQGDLPRVRGTLLADRVVVDDAQRAELHRREHLGIPTGAGLVLSFTEAESLRRRGVLDVDGALATHAPRVQAHFSRTLPVFEALRATGVVAKSGFKFGTHLRGYRGDPDDGHAQWLIQCVAAGDPLQWADLSRAIRLAHGVRKRLLLAVVGPAAGPGAGGARDVAPSSSAPAVEFLHLSWFKP